MACVSLQRTRSAVRQRRLHAAAPPSSTSTQGSDPGAMRLRTAACTRRISSEPEMTSSRRPTLIADAAQELAPVVCSPARRRVATAR